MTSESSCDTQSNFLLENDVKITEESGQWNLLAENNILVPLVVKERKKL